MKNKIFFLILCFFSINTYSSSCDYFPKHEFLGVFSKIEYECEENNNRGSTCYTNADRYKHVSRAVVNLIPLAVEQGIQIKLEDSIRLEIKPQIVMLLLLAQNKSLMAYKKLKWDLVLILLKLISNLIQF